MHNFRLGWQSWSPISPSYLKLPLWDYCPIPTPAFTAVRREAIQKPVSLWCSWHANATNISQSLILEQSTKFLSHKYVPSHILIDDGWCSWGDWTSPDTTKFPNWSDMLKRLKGNGYKFGLWIAPFMIDANSRIFHDHPDWIFSVKGVPQNVFASYPIFNQFHPKYLLDFTSPEVISYLENTFSKFILDWDIDLLKIDHLYAPYFAHDPLIASHASQAISNIFAFLSRNFPQTYLLACGCPFDVAAGQVDSIRISKDINSPALKNIPFLDKWLYLKRKNLLNSKLSIALSQPLPFGIDPDAAINLEDAAKYHKLWQSGKIKVFGLGYNL